MFFKKYLITMCLYVATVSAFASDLTTLKNQPQVSEIEIFWNAGQKEKAYNLVEKWMKLDRSSAWPWVQSAILRYREKKYKKSLSELQVALDKNPSCAEAYYWRGKNFEMQNKPMDAANEYRAALVIEDKFVDAREALNRVLALLGSS